MINLNMTCSLGRLPGYRFSIILLLALLMTAPGVVEAQPSGLDDDPGQSVPLDGGLSLLLGAGVCYGARRMNLRNRSRDVSVKGRPKP